MTNFFKYLKAKLMIKKLTLLSKKPALIQKVWRKNINKCENLKIIKVDKQF